MVEILELGKVSSRGQIAIPIDIRKEMKLHDGEKVLFVLEDDTLIIKKISKTTFSAVTAPLQAAVKKSGLKEKDVQGIIERFRKQK